MLPWNSRFNNALARRGDAPGTRTPNLVIKSHLLCQIELARRFRFYLLRRCPRLVTAAERAATSNDEMDVSP